MGDGLRLTGSSPSERRHVSIGVPTSSVVPRDMACGVAASPLFSLFPWSSNSPAAGGMCGEPQQGVLSRSGGGAGPCGKGMLWEPRLRPTFAESGCGGVETASGCPLLAVDDTSSTASSPEDCGGGAARRARGGGGGGTADHSAGISSGSRSLPASLPASLPPSLHSRGLRPATSSSEDCLRGASSKRSRTSSLRCCVGNGDFGGNGGIDLGGISSGRAATSAARVNSARGRNAWPQRVFATRGRNTWSQRVVAARGRNAWSQRAVAARGRNAWSQQLDDSYTP